MFINIDITESTNVSVQSVQSLRPVWLFATPWTAAWQASLPSSTTSAYSNSRPLDRWCHPVISSSVIPFSSYLQSFPASQSFQMSQLFASVGQNIGVSASTSVFPVISNIQGWFPLELTELISLQFKGLSRVFPSTTVWKHQFFDTQLSLWSNSHKCIWLLERP